MSIFSKLTTVAASMAMLASAVVTPALGLSAPATGTDFRPVPLSRGGAPEQQGESQDDWARVKAAGKLIVGTSADYPPFEYYSSNYQLDGFDIQLMKELAKRMGVTVEFNDFAFDSLGDTLNLKQVDAAIAAISVVPERQKKWDFSNLYYYGADAVLGRSDYKGKVTSATDLAGKKLGVQRGTTYQAWAQANLVDKGLSKQSDIVAYQDNNTMVRDLKGKKIDLVLAGTQPVKTAAKQSAGTLKVVGEGTNTQSFGIAARKGSTLIAELNKALVAVQSDGTFAKLVQQYLNAKPSEVTPAKPTVTNPKPETTGGGAVAPECIYGLQWVADVTYDDKNMTAPPELKPGQQFVKTWRVRNNGTCAWNANFALDYVRGNVPEARMGGQPTAVGRAVQPGETIDISVNLQAPYNYGTYQGFWQMRTPEYKYFGETLWVGITVPNPNPPPPPPPSDINPNLRADQQNLSQGQCTTIRWDVDNVAAVYFIDPYTNGGNPQAVGGHDSRNVCPPTTTTYTLRVQRRDGVVQDFPITIYVSGATSITFTVDSSTINQGQCTTLRWDVQNVQAVYLNDQGVPGTGSQQVCPATTTTYTLKVIMRDGSTQTRQITVNVIPTQQAGPSISSFTANANTIQLGACVDLSWTTQNASGTRLDRNGTTIWSNAPTNGSFKDCPPSAGIAEYALTAFGNGSTTSKLTVNVQGASVQPPIAPPPSERAP